MKIFLVGILGIMLMNCGSKSDSKAEPPVAVPLQPAHDNANNVDNDHPPAGWNAWDDFNLADPASRSLHILDGSDPAQDLLGEDPLCSIFILAEYINDQSQTTYVLRTSFKHNHQTHGYLLLSVDRNATSATGTGASGQDQIFFKLAKPGDFYSATLMNLKWFHINHYDTGVCENLHLRGSVGGR